MVEKHECALCLRSEPLLPGAEVTADGAGIAQLIESLPAVQRLAMAYAPRAARGPTLALLALDQRLARTLSQVSEPIAAQLRLAWWRDTLKAGLKGEGADPLFGALLPWQGLEEPLIALVDAWEEMLTDPPLPSRAMEGLADARAMCFVALSRVLDCRSGREKQVAPAARIWALADLAAGLSDPQERAVCCGLAHEMALVVAPLPRPLRTLSVLAGLGARSIRKGRTELLHGPADMLLAIRIGMTGR